MNLPKRRRGVSDLEITTADFGACAIGGGGWAFDWGPQDDEVSIHPPIADNDVVGFGSRIGVASRMASSSIHSALPS